MPNNIDESLIELSNSIDPFVESTSSDSTFAVFCLGARLNTDADGELATYLAVSGHTNILEEALYAELSSQIVNGNRQLYDILSNVVQSVEHSLSDELENLDNDLEDLSEDVSADSGNVTNNSLLHARDFDFSSLNLDDNITLIIPPSNMKKS